jgi:hypothetical protein
MFNRKPINKVSPIQGFPQSSVGAPCTALFSTVNSLTLFFYLQQSEPNWDGASDQIGAAESEGKEIAIINFECPSMHIFGPPNDGIFSDHRLAPKGLRSYGAFEVFKSAWIAQLEKMNEVNPRHNRARFMADKNHFIIAFHDSTFECIAKGYQIEYRNGSIKKLLQSYVDSLST